MPIYRDPNQFGEAPFRQRAGRHRWSSGLCQRECFPKFEWSLAFQTVPASSMTTSSLAAAFFRSEIMERNAPFERGLIPNRALGAMPPCWSIRFFGRYPCRLAQLGLGMGQPLRFKPRIASMRGRALRETARRWWVPRLWGRKPSRSLTAAGEIMGRPGGRPLAAANRCCAATDFDQSGCSA